MNHVCLLCCLPYLLCCQIFYKRNDTALLVKWYNQPLIAAKGCTVITPQHQVTVLPFQNTITGSLQPLAVMCRQAEGLEGVAALTVLLHTFHHPELAQYAGISLTLPVTSSPPLQVRCGNGTLKAPIALHPLPPPPVLQRSPTHKQTFMLQWQRIIGVYGFLVHAITDSTTICLTPRPLLDTSVQVTKQKAIGYFIQAIDVFGDTSLPSNIVALPAECPPLAGLKGNTVNNGLCLTWQHCGYRVFEVQRRADNDSVFTSCATLTASSFTDTPKRYGLYHYRVRGVLNDSLMGPFAEIKLLHEDHDAPPPPQVVNCGNDERSPLVYWQPVVADDRCGYVLFRVLHDSVPLYIKQFTEPIRETSVRVAPTPTSHWCVATVDWKGNRSPCSAVATCHWQSHTAPPAPFVYAAQTIEQRIVVKWLPLTNASHVRIWLLPISSERSEAVCVRTLPGNLCEWSLFITQENGLYRLWLEAVSTEGKSSSPSNTVSLRLKGTKKKA